MSERSGSAAEHRRLGLEGAEGPGHPSRGTRGQAQCFWRDFEKKNVM